MKRLLRLAGPRQARGIVLLVSLALLTVLTLAALAAAQTTLLELAMARNDEDALRAFLAADGALAEAEIWLRGNARDPASLFTAGGADGLFAAPAYGATNSATASLLAGGGRAAGAPPHVAAPPRYVVEWLRSHTDSGTPLRPLPPATVDLYRVTARGVGASGAAVMLQTTYGQTRDGGTARALTGRLSWAQVGD